LGRSPDSKISKIQPRLHPANTAIDPLQPHPVAPIQTAEQPNSISRIEKRVDRPSPLTPFKEGKNDLAPTHSQNSPNPLKVPLLKGDLGGSTPDNLHTQNYKKRQPNFSPSNQPANSGLTIRHSPDDTLTQKLQGNETTLNTSPAIAPPPESPVIAPSHPPPNTAPEPSQDSSNYQTEIEHPSSIQLTTLPSTESLISPRLTQSTAISLKPLGFTQSLAHSIKPNPAHSDITPAESSPISDNSSNSYANEAIQLKNSDINSTSSNVETPTARNSTDQSSPNQIFHHSPHQDSIDEHYCNSPIQRRVDQSQELFSNSSKNYTKQSSLDTWSTVSELLHSTSTNQQVHSSKDAIGLNNQPQHQTISLLPEASINEKQISSSDNSTVLNQDNRSQSDKLEQQLDRLVPLVHQLLRQKWQLEHERWFNSRTGDPSWLNDRFDGDRHAKSRNHQHQTDLKFLVPGSPLFSKLQLLSHQVNTLIQRKLEVEQERNKH
jgi:hypothetical protein